MKYKVGDLVEIRNDLKVGEVYGDLTWYRGMDEIFLGKTATIKVVAEGKIYQIDRFAISEEMIKGKILWKIKCAKTHGPRFELGKEYYVNEDGTIVGDCNDVAENVFTTNSYEEWYKDCNWFKYAFELIEDYTKEKVQSFDDLIKEIKHDYDTHKNNPIFDLRLDVKDVETLLKGVEELREKAKPSNFEVLLGGLMEWDIEDYELSWQYNEVRSRNPVLNLKICLSNEVAIRYMDAKSDFFGWLKEPYEKPTNKLTQFEYDLLDSINMKEARVNLTIARPLMDKGYFKGLVGVTQTVGEILDNYEVINEKI